MSIVDECQRLRMSRAPAIRPLGLGAAPASHAHARRGSSWSRPLVDNLTSASILTFVNLDSVGTSSVICIQGFQYHGLGGSCDLLIHHAAIALFTIHQKTETAMQEREVQLNTIPQVIIALILGSSSLLLSLRLNNMLGVLPPAPITCLVSRASRVEHSS